MTISSSLSKKLTTPEIVQVFREIEEYPERAPELRSFLVRKMSYLPCSLVAKYSRLPNYNDLKQVAYETFYKAILTFDYKKSSNFSGWCWWWIRKEVAISARREKEYFDSFVEFSPGYIDNEEHYEFEDAIVERQREDLLKSIILDFDSRERRVLEVSLGFSGSQMSLRDFAEEFGMSHEGVRKVKTKAIEKAASLYFKCERSC